MWTRMVVMKWVMKKMCHKTTRKPEKEDETPFRIGILPTAMLVTKQKMVYNTTSWGRLQNAIKFMPYLEWRQCGKMNLQIVKRSSDAAFATKAFGPLKVWGYIIITTTNNFMYNYNVLYNFICNRIKVNLWKISITDDSFHVTCYIITWVIDCQTGFKLSKYWVNLGSEMLQLGSDSVHRP